MGAAVKPAATAAMRSDSPPSTAAARSGPMCCVAGCCHKAQNGVAASKAAPLLAQMGRGQRTTNGQAGDAVKGVEDGRAPGRPDRPRSQRDR